MADEPTNATIAQIVTQLANSNQNMSLLIQAVQALAKISYGTITWTAASTVVVANTAVTANSVIVWAPTNASAGTLTAGATSPYLSARTAGASFTLATANAAAAAGGETYAFFLYNPS